MLGKNEFVNILKSYSFVKYWKIMALQYYKKQQTYNFIIIRQVSNIILAFFIDNNEMYLFKVILSQKTHTKNIKSLKKILVQAKSLLSL